MKIYDVEGFPNPMRVRVALSEVGASDAVEFIPVDVMGGEHRTEAFKAKNPDASVPCLELDDGTFISQSTAITEYIDCRYGKNALFGVEPKERAVISMMNKRAESALLDAVADYFHFATEGLGPDLETYQNKEWGQRQRDRAVATMQYVDNVLADREFVAGDAFSVADITVFAGLAFAEFAKIDVPADLTNLIAWRQRVGDRPSIAA